MRRLSFVGLLVLSACVGLDDDDSTSDDDDSGPPPCLQMFRGTPERQGHTAHVIPRVAPAARWAVNVSGLELGGGDLVWGGFPSDDEFTDELEPYDGAMFLGAGPLICDGLIYQGTRGGYLTAVDAVSGVVRWQRDLVGELNGTMVLTDEHILIGTTAEEIHLLERPTAGRPVWTFPMREDSLASAAVVDDVAYTSDKSGYVVAIELESGEARWERQLGSTTSSSASFPPHREMFVLAERDGLIHGIDTATGGILWSEDTGAQVISTAAWFEGVFYIGGWDNKLHAVAEDGTPRWRFETRANITASPTVTDDRVFFGSWDWTLYAVDRESGEEVWSTDFGSDLLASPVWDGRSLLVVTEDGGLHGVDATSGDILWRVDMNVRSIATPLVGADAIYSVGVNGDLFRWDH
jgi:outer membrane protein assembly factor BamB